MDGYSINANPVIIAAEKCRGQPNLPFRSCTAVGWSSISSGTAVPNKQASKETKKPRKHRQDESHYHYSVSICTAGGSIPDIWIPRSLSLQKRSASSEWSVAQKNELGVSDDVSIGSYSTQSVVRRSRPPQNQALNPWILQSRSRKLT